jgi:hypothetical protein
MLRKFKTGLRSWKPNVRRIKSWLKIRRHNTGKNWNKEKSSSANFKRDNNNFGKKKRRLSSFA